MELKDYLLSDGKKELKITKVNLSKNEWNDFLSKLKSDNTIIKTSNSTSEINQVYLSRINRKKCIPLIENINLFPNSEKLMSITSGALGNAYFRLHWALNSCPQTSEFNKEINKNPIDIFNNFLRWWKMIRTTKLAGYIALSKIDDNKFKINDLSGFIAQSINYDEKAEINNEDDYDKLHLKYITPWVLASEICLNLKLNGIISLPDDKGFMTIK